ncbi:glycosyltransferase family 4 protein [Thermodesulfobacteriota bacterium]
MTFPEDCAAEQPDARRVSISRGRIGVVPVVILLQDLEYGGTQRYAIHLANHLDRRLFAPRLWILRRGKEMLPLLTRSDIPVLWLSRSSWVSPAAIVNLLVRLLRFRPRLVYTLTVVPNIWGRVLGRLARVPTIVSGYRNLRPRQYEKRLWRMSDRIICNAHVLKEIMTQRYCVDPNRIDVIPNATEVDVFSPRPRSRTPKPSILFLGRLVDQKDPLTLVKGFQRVLCSLPEAHLELVGNGPLQRALQEWIRTRSLEAKITLKPGTANVLPYLRKAWVLALPAWTGEGSPNVIIEAMACGTPVVATQVGGIPELVEHGRTGLIVAPRDPYGLSRALEHILTDGALREAMAARARERVLKLFGLPRMIRDTERSLLRAMRESRNP